MAIRVFISHTSDDLELVGCFVQALEAYLQIPSGQIRCTSLAGYKPRSGAHTSTTLRAELAEADVVIGVLTPSSLESGWVMFELGAGWGANKWVVPVIAGIDYDSLPGPLKGSNATDAATRSEIEQLFYEIGMELKLATFPPGRASDAIDELVEEAEEYDEDEDELGDGDGDEEDDDYR